MPSMPRCTNRRMPPADPWLDHLTNMLAELEEYLLSPELFWPLGSRNPAIPEDRLTLGNLLLSLDQLNALRQNWDIHAETNFRKLELIWEQSLEKWKSAIVKKAEQEIRSRMNLWTAYLQDLDEGQAGQFDYRREVRNRVILERLFDLDVLREAWEVELQSADRLHRSLVEPSEFIWSEPLQSQYPRESFWFLYRMPRKKDRF
jgi:hypothetical protein